MEKRLKKWGLKGFVILCVSVFCVYEIQEIVWVNLEEYGPPQQPAVSSTSKSVISSQQKNFLSQNLTQENNEEELELSKKSQVWITMSLCWSANAQIYDKQKFPYRHAALLSSQLWMRMTPAKIIMQIVYSEDEVSDELKDYKLKLESFGVIVFLVKTGSDIKCALKSQIIRILAYLFPFVKSNDIIVTADVDAFVMTPEIYQPLIKMPKKKIWLYRYSNTVSSGSTFMMPFIGAKAHVWREILEYDESGDFPNQGNIGNNIPNMIKSYGMKMNFNDSCTWEQDQHIVSYGILNSGYCTLPITNKLWKELGIKPKCIDDTETCWHGSGIYEDCNNLLWSRNMMIRYKGKKCKWWHFTSHETKEILDSKFKEIISGRAESPWMNSVLSKLFDSLNLTAM